MQVSAGLHRPITGLQVIDPKSLNPQEAFFFEFHHRRALAALATGPFDFFVNTSGLGGSDTNWPYNDGKFSRGNAFDLWGIGFEFALRSGTADGASPASSIDYRRAVFAHNNFIFRLTIEGKSYVDNRFSELLSGAGLTSEFFGRDAPAGALPSIARVELGFPVPDAQFTLTPGVTIGSLYQVQARLETELAIPAAEGFSVRLWLSGTLHRNVQ